MRGDGEDATLDEEDALERIEVGVRQGVKGERCTALEGGCSGRMLCGCGGGGGTAGTVTLIRIEGGERIRS